MLKIIAGLLLMGTVAMTSGCMTLMGAGTGAAIDHHNPARGAVRGGIIGAIVDAAAMGAATGGYYVSPAERQSPAFQQGLVDGQAQAQAVRNRISYERGKMIGSGGLSAGYSGVYYAPRPLPPIYYHPEYRHRYHRR